MQPGQPADVRGTLHRPPNDGQCDTGLVLLEIDPEVDWTLCAPSCSETDSECPLPELLTCQQSVCKLARTWGAELWLALWRLRAEGREIPWVLPLR